MSLYLFTQFRIHLANTAASIFGLRCKNLVAIFHLNLSLERVVEGALQRFLSKTKAKRSRILNHCLCHLNCFFYDVFVSNNLVCEAPLKQFFSTNTTSSHKCFSSASITNDARKIIGARHVSTGKTNVEVTSLHLEGFAANTQVTSASQRETAADCMALQSTNDWLHSIAHVYSLIRTDSLHNAVITLSTAHILRWLIIKLVQVKASAERLALTGKNDYTAFWVHANLLQIIVEVSHLLIRHCIEISSVIERNNVDRTTNVYLQALVLILEFGQAVCLLIYAHARSPSVSGFLI